jgi:hypothetical protein
VRHGAGSLREALLGLVAAAAVAGVLGLSAGRASRDGAWADDVRLAALVDPGPPAVWPVRLRSRGVARVAAGGGPPRALGPRWLRVGLRDGEVLQVDGLPGEAVEAVILGPPGSRQVAGQWSVPPGGRLRLVLQAGRAPQGVRAILPR